MLEMKIDVPPLFPEMFAGPLDVSIIQRARAAGLLDLRIHNLRDYTHDRHRTVDDRPFGGGPGMILKPEPLFEAVENLAGAATQFLFAAKGQNIPTVLVGHVTKDGNLAGPKALEHVVDTARSEEHTSELK